MTPAPLFCNRCGHYADKHSGSYGCIDRTDGEDCWCTRTYTQITEQATHAKETRP